jgi:hypothetical protein
LEALKELVSKTDDGKYRLSDMGEGAIELMERIEEPPKPASVPDSVAVVSSKKGRRLIILQMVTIIAALVLFVSGSGLSSVTSVQEYYNLPYQSYSVKEPTIINGNTYDTAINTTVPPTQLIDNHAGVISVGFKSLENISSGTYMITLNYLEYIPNEDQYVERQINYTGDFIPVAKANDEVFSKYLSMPISSYVTPKQLVPVSIVFSFWMNTTEPNPSILPIIRAPISLSQGYYYINHPYEKLGETLTKLGALTLIIAIILSVTSLLKTRLNKKTPLNPS